MFKFKVVSTGKKTGNLSADPTLSIAFKTNRFKLNHKAAVLIGVKSGDSVTVLCDPEAKLFAVHAAIPDNDKDGNQHMKEVKLSKERKEELIKEGEEIPTEGRYVNGCKLGGHLEFASSEAVMSAGIEKNITCELAKDETGEPEVGPGEDYGINVESKVAVFSYADAVETDESQEEAEETQEEEEN